MINATVETHEPHLPPAEALPNGIVTNFTDSLRRINHPSSHMGLIPPLSEDNLNTPGDYRRYLPNGLNLDHELPWGDNREVVNATFGFELDRVKGFEAESSAHHVFFGKIAMTFTDKDEVMLVPVVIKKFDRDPKKATHEYYHLKTLAENGFSVFTPLGILKDENTAYLITYYEDSLSTYDKQNWLYHTTSPEEKSLMKLRLKGAAEALAELHVRGRTFHGDAKTRNFVLTIEGDTRLIDFESSTHLPNRRDWIDQFKTLATEDIMTFYKSLEEGKGIFYKQLVQNRNNLFRNLFLNHYLKAVIGDAQANTNSEGLEELRAALVSLQDTVYFSIYKDWDKKRLPPARRDPEALDLGKKANIAA